MFTLRRIIDDYAIFYVRERRIHKFLIYVLKFEDYNRTKECNLTLDAQ